MVAMQNVFLLFKSDPKSSSTELARFISKFPGMREVWLTEGEYSFVARFAAPIESVPQLKSRITKNRAIMDVTCIHAPVVLKG